jgi:predicted transcriptional regulator
MKRHEKLQQFNRIQHDIEERCKTNEEIQKERMRAYELIKNKLDVDMQNMLGEYAKFTYLDEQNKKYQEKRHQVVQTHREKEKKLEEFSDQTLETLKHKFSISSMRRGKFDFLITNRWVHDRICC